MRILFIVAVMIMLAACHKENNPPSMSRTDFFNNELEAAQKVQSLLDRRSKGEKLERIENISYIDSKNKSYAFVFYQSNKGFSNIVLQQQYLNGQKSAMTSVTCAGSNCSCKVSTTISNAGDVTVGCSCSSCTMMVNQ